MERKFTGIHGVIVMVVIVILIASTVVYIVSKDLGYEIINASEINDYVGKKVKTTVTPIEEIEIPLILDEHQYRCKEDNVIISSSESLELNKIIIVYGEVREHEERIILFVE